MPHITICGVPEQEAREATPGLLQALLDSTGVAAEHVKVLYSPLRRLDGPDEVAVDLFWFPRPQETCDRAAQAFTDYWKGRGYDYVRVTITECPASHYYENGKHY